MNQKRTFSFEDLSIFVNSQRDEREIRMVENDSSEEYGCILVHFGLAAGEKHVHCGMISITSDFKADKNSCFKVMNFINQCCKNDVTSYKEAKQILKET